MGCRHGYGPGHCGSWHGTWHGPNDAVDWYEDAPWPMRLRRESGVRSGRAASLEDRLNELREDLRRVEAALADLARPSRDAPRQE
jgi:hypothetical protein